MAGVTGGHNLKRLIRNARKPGVTKIEVGFFPEARYTEGKRPFVASVAAWNEFGTSRAPSRPFMRVSVDIFKPNYKNFVRTRINPQTMKVDRLLANQLASMLKSQIQTTIVELNHPRNAEITIARKRAKLHGKKSANTRWSGKETALIDTGYMRQSVTYKIF